MDTEQLPNYRKHPSHILDVRKTHPVWRNPGEWNCDSCRLQRSELIESISFWPFYSQKGDRHPPGMAHVYCMPLLWMLWLPQDPVCLLQVSWITQSPLPTLQWAVIYSPVYYWLLGVCRHFQKRYPLSRQARQDWLLGQESKKTGKGFLHIFVSWPRRQWKNSPKK